MGGKLGCVSSDSYSWMDYDQPDTHCCECLVVKVCNEGGGSRSGISGEGRQHLECEGR